MRRSLLVTIATLLLALVPAPTSAAETVVCPSCPLQDLQTAIQQAPEGSVIRVRGGVYTGLLVIDRPLTLLGEEWPVLDGGGVGTVVKIAAPNVHVEGFIVRGSGTSHDREDSGILVTAPRARVIGNQVLDALFGIQLLNAPDSLVQGNLVVGKALPEAQRGDAIKLWYSPRTQIIGNHVQDSRDVLVWYSDETLVRGNLVERGRYGVHFMYSQDSLIIGNTLRDNSVGLYLMYGARQIVRENVFAHNRGPSGYGLALKETDGVIAEGNLLMQNRVGLFIDNSPISQGVWNEIRGNWLAYNDVGLRVSPGTRNNTIVENAFLENLDQVLTHGAGRLSSVTWADAGRGNFWSDYIGYDADRDGIGDLSYQPQSLSSTLVERSPLFAFFRYSLTAAALDFASRALPLFQPAPRLVDPAPLLHPPTWPAVPWQPTVRSPWMAVVVWLLLALTALPLIGASLKGRYGWRLAAAVAGQPANMTLAEESAGARRTIVAPDMAPVATQIAPVVQVEGLSKRYGERLVLENVHFSIFPGEAVALWGPNGAGKTTVLRCLLGRTSYDGVVRVFGYSPLREGPAVRARIGYVPQQLPLLDLPVGELVTIVARLRGEALEQAWERLVNFGLGSTWQQPVRALSGGMQQRLALTLATIGDPPLLLLDEPTANLDAKGREELLTLLEQLCHEGRTILFASHRYDDVWRLATRVLRLEAGRIVAEETASAPHLRSKKHVLLLELEPDAVQPATHLLTAHGFALTRDGQWLRVTVPAERKAEPFYLLARIGVQVRDFQLEATDAW